MLVWMRAGCCFVAFTWFVGKTRAKTVNSHTAMKRAKAVGVRHVLHGPFFSRSPFFPSQAPGEFSGRWFAGAGTRPAGDTVGAWLAHHRPQTHSPDEARQPATAVSVVWVMALTSTREDDAKGTHTAHTLDKRVYHGVCDSMCLTTHLHKLANGGVCDHTLRGSAPKRARQGLPTLQQRSKVVRHAACAVNMATWLQSHTVGQRAEANLALQVVDAGILGGSVLAGGSAREGDGGGWGGLRRQCPVHMAGQQKSQHMGYAVGTQS